MGKKRKRKQQQSKHKDKYDYSSGVRTLSSHHIVRFDGPGQNQQKHHQKNHHQKHKHHYAAASYAMMDDVIEEVFGPTRNYNGSLSQNR